MSADRLPKALRSGEGEALWCVGALTTVKATGEQTAGAYALIEDHAPQGAGTPLHRHAHDDEAFYVLDGEVTFFLGDSTPMRAEAGAFVHIPGGVAHAFQVESPTARYLIVTTPRHASFYRAIAEPAQARCIPPAAEMNMDVIGAACETYGIELVGPAPAAVS